MKKLLFTLLFFGLCFSAQASNDPKVGDELIIKAPVTQSYHYIKFPKPNILIKRGTVTGYKSVRNNTVIVSAVTTNDDGSIEVELTKKDGTKFFGFLSKVKANYTKAIDANELAIAK
ncbi:hypothetical protein HNV10_05575 [Winogradskyella litoriviva]|uniref:Dihydroorotase n=1 Tax=Winogradskyella litoriviva TaxID=1220182 RepID=A0ABX2E4J3_9FLAO|nr:hypothetical protein [Winogradskyella litoriviva]NRD22699.1 hypothetical protein [Winogradskyella litoriviva]